MEHPDTFEVRQAREALEEAIAKANLVMQLEKIRLDEEMGALGWHVLMRVHYEDAWQQTGWVWIKTGEAGVEHVALMNGPPNDHCGFIKLLSVEELKALIVKEAE